MESLKRKINEIKFKDIEDILVGDMLHYRLEEAGNGDLRNIFSMLFFKNYDFKVSGNPDTLCFSGCGKNRKDQMDAFCGVVELINNKVTMVQSEKKFSFIGLKNIAKLLVWNKQLKTVVPDKNKRIFLLGNMFHAYLAFKLFEQNKKRYSWNINKLVTFCDVLPTDYFFLSKLNDECDITVTLQHGVFSVTSNKWAYSGSRSKYFLLDSQHTVDGAVMSGYKGKPLAVGSIHNMNKTVEERVPVKNNVIGVFCNSVIFPEEDNTEMIRVVEAFCEVNGKKLLIKLHPTNDIAKYEKIINKQVSTICDKNVTVDEFAEQIELAIVGISTVFTAMLFKSIPSLLFYREGFDQNFYLNSEEVKFSTTERLKTLVEKIGTKDFNKIMERYKNYYLLSGNIKENYKRVFKEIGINDDKQNN